MKYFRKGFCRIAQVISNVLFNYYVIFSILTSSILVITSPSSMADEIVPTFTKNIETSAFSPSSPDPGGIVYLPLEDAFLITDSEANELPYSQTVNAFKVNRIDSNLQATLSTLSFSNEPTGVTFNSANNHCFFSDDDARKIYEVTPGAAGNCLTGIGDTFTSFSLGDQDPEDVAYAHGSLLIVDGASKKIYQIMPGTNNVFDDFTSPDSDDVISSFDTLSLGLTDPEGIVFDQKTDTLYMVGSQKSLIVQTTLYGVLLNTIDLSNVTPFPNKPAGLALAPSTDALSDTSLYMVTRGIDNNTTSSEDPNDGMMFELGLPKIDTTNNLVPEVTASGDLQVTMPNNISLNGSINDDGLPINTLNAIWSKHSGPGEVSFANDARTLNTTASFSEDGTYILRLTGYDGELYSFDDISITVYPAPPPAILNVPSIYPTIEDAVSAALEGDTILLAPGEYTVNSTIAITKKNITISSEYSKENNDETNNDIIDTTIIKPGSSWIDNADPEIKGIIFSVRGQGANLKVIGLTIQGGHKGITFAESYGEVHYCKLYDIDEDAISFDRNAGGAVTHTRVERAGDDSIDVDTKIFNGTFLFAYNELIDSGDDTIEIHLYNYNSVDNMHFDIHDNLFSGAIEDGIQLIDWLKDNEGMLPDYDGNSNRTFDIYRNIFENMTDVGISSVFNTTAEDFQGTAMVERVRIYNNYFYNNAYHITGGDNMIILNNIFEQAGMTGINRAKGDSITDFNLFYNNPTDTLDTVIGISNLYEDPQRNSDFTLQLASPAIGAGTANYTYHDESVLAMASNEYVGQNPDMGRFEYVLNDISPAITLNGANPMKLNRGETFTDPGATATDDRDGNLTDEIESNSNVDTSVAATYSVIYEVADSDGNTASISRTVIVGKNTVKPVITLNGDNPLTFTADYIDTFKNDPGAPGATATDDLDGVLTGAIQTSYVETSVPGSYLVTYTVSDTDGNIASITRSVVIEPDTTIAPVIILLGANSITLNRGETFTDPGATATDDRDGNLTDEIVPNSNVNTDVAATYSVTYTVTDSDGNMASINRTVIVGKNTVKPLITLIGANPITLSRGGTFTDPGATASDDLDGNLTDNIDSSSNVNTAVAATYSVIYTVTDSDGNMASISRIVIVGENTINPVITLTGANPITLNRGGTFTDPGATASDDLDGNLTDNIDSSSNVNTAVAATYLVIYTVTDSDGNTATIGRTVIVGKNTIEPVLTLIGANPLTLTADGIETFKDDPSAPGATAKDDLDGDLTDAIQASYAETSAPGSYLVTYTVSDTDGNIASISRSVVVDPDSTITPVIILNGANPMYFTIGETFTDPGATALDELDGNITDDIEITSNVDETVPGTYEIVYTVTDSDGNSTSLDREVIVTIEAVSTESSSSSGGGSTNSTVLLFIALAFFFRMQRKGRLI